MTVIDEYQNSGKAVVTFAALLQVALFLAHPGYRLLALISVLLAAIALRVLKKRSNKRLFVVCYVALGVYGFLIGQFFYGTNRLTDTGATMLLAGVPVAIFVGLRAMAADSDAA